MSKLFDLNFQLIGESFLTLIAVAALVVALSYFLWNPIRKLLKDRQNRIESDLNAAAMDKLTAEETKIEYEKKLREADKEIDEILIQARKKALENEARIIEEAKEEATRIIARANEEAVLEKKRAADEIKKEMISIASLMAAKVVVASINTEIQDQLVEETLREMGDATWQS